ncbi:branched-chain amino acid ABC transporter substrate-binding protein [Maridesulfovibrio sp. FT414]
MLTVGSFGSAIAGGKVVLGVPGAHSGDLAAYGLPTVEAAKLVVKAINDAGGVNGMQVAISTQDDQCKPEFATNAAMKLLSDGVTVVLGHICSGATKAALPIYKESNLVCMSPSATNPPLTQSGDYPNFFRTIASDDAQAALAAKFAMEKLGLKNIAIIHDKGDYGKGFAEFAQKYVEEAGVKVALFEGVTPGAVDYSAVVQKIKSTGADGVIFGGYHPEASKIVSQIRKKKMTIPFVSDDGVKGKAFIDIAGEAAEGVYATGPLDITGNPMYKVALDQYKATHEGGEPGAFYFEAYSAALALLKAIDNAKSTDYDKIVEALRTTEVETPVGNIKFDAKGDAIGVGFSVYQVKNGEYVEVK